MDKALVAININCKCGIIIEHYGKNIHEEIKKYSIWLEDLELDVPGFGIWIWEGNVEYILDDNDKTYGINWNGNWRKPNKKELDKISNQEKLWNYQNPS